MPAEGRENPLLKKGNSDAFFREKYLTKNNFASTAGLILLGGWAFFDRLGGWKKKKDTAIPPGHRRILKKGRL